MSDRISDLASEGRADSSGTFSLDVLAAQRKLARLSQAQPGLMLGKLVQAAVAGAAHSLAFTIGSNEIRACLDFTSAVTNLGRVQKHLAMAVALAQVVQPSELSWQSGGQKYSLVDPAHSPDDLAIRGPSVFSFRARPTSFWDGLKELLGQRHNSAQFVYERCLRCPVPVSIDARPVNNPTWSIQGDLQCDLVELAPPEAEPRQIILASTQQLNGYGTTWLNDQRFTADPLRPHQPVVMLDVPAQPEIVTAATLSDGLLLAKSFEMVREYDDGSYREVERVLSRTVWLNHAPYLSQSQLRARTWARMLRRSLPSTLFPVLDGLQLDKVSLPNCPPGCTVIRAVSDLAVDLDQLHLIQDDAFRSMEQELAQLLERSLARWKKYE
ncbi:MAG: hypothetical protein U0931_31310 [Vulcanimicrobiota bacterium]